MYKQVFTSAVPILLATNALRKISRASAFLPIASSNLGLSGSHDMAKKAKALEQLLIRMYRRHGRISINPNRENCQARGIINIPISGWYTIDRVMNMAANVTCLARVRLL